MTVISEYPFLIVYCPDEYKTLRMSGKTVDDSLAALNILLIGLFQIKPFKKIYTTLYGDENILFFNKDSRDVVFSCNEMGMLNIDLNNINPDNNFDEDDPDTIIFIKLLARYIKFEKHKALKNHKGIVDPSEIAS